MKGCLIYYVFDTLSERNLKLSMDSIRRSDVKLDTLIVYNNSTTFHKSPLLLVLLDQVRDNFKHIRYFTGSMPNTKSVMDDVNHQIANIAGYDYYICHKADFYLPKSFLARVIEHEEVNPGICQFINCAKFDLRENVCDIAIRQYADYELWSEIAARPDACPHYNVPGFGTQHKAVGYNGVDGCMHFYSEAARKKLHFDSFTAPHTWNANIARGVDMRCGVDRFYALHVYHELPRPDPKKQVKGHRF